MREAPTLVSVVTVLIVAAVVIGAGRQMQHDHMAEPSPGAVLVEDTGSELIISTAPVHLPAAEGGHGHDGSHEAVLPPVATITVPMHGYLRGFDYEVIDADGNVLPRQIVHHFNVIDPDHRELFLPISQRLLAAGQETGAQSMPRLLFGVPVYTGQPLVVSAMLHNPTGETHQGVTLRIKLKYVKVGRPWPLFEVFPFQLDVAFPAGDKSFDLPPGHSTKSWEGSPAMAGRIMVLGSHLHELATHITFDDLTTGKTLWTGFPVVSDAGDLEGVTIGHVYRKLGIKIHPDRRYRVTVHYDNPAPDTLVGGGMGVVAGVFMPSGGITWPRAETGNELYALDRRHYMRELRGRYGVIATDDTTATAEEHAGH